MKQFCLYSFFYLFAPALFAADSTSYAPLIALSKNGQGLGTLSFRNGNGYRNFIDTGAALGHVRLQYKEGDNSHSGTTADWPATIVSNEKKQIEISYTLPGGLMLRQKYAVSGTDVIWDMTATNRGKKSIEVTDLSFQMPIGKFNRRMSVQDNLSRHTMINGNASFCFWIPYSGYGNILLMTPAKGTSLEYLREVPGSAPEMFIHAATAVDRQNDSWRLPGSTAKIKPGTTKSYTFRFQLAGSQEEIRTILYNSAALDVVIAPGMTVPNDMSVRCLIRSKAGIKRLIAEWPLQTSIKFQGKRQNGYREYKLAFSRPGENMLTVEYGDKQIAYLNFFSTEPLETLIRKRSRFIVTKQQILDTSKWYNGLYSIWDMQQQKLLSPDDKGPLPDFVVGGSDDPSNGKPLYVAEKNAIFPDSAEIASLEYYQKNFVWGKLQRTGEEYPYPYGIYGSENWYENRSGRVADYNSGGLGKERMWRTFDYTTHLAIYYNLYRIAKSTPSMVTYLDADGYLDRAYRTAMAFFEVPYNIEMGEQWNFHGWTDWAYKQGNFHERYITDIIAALENDQQWEKADKLRREWEKKVKYFIYDDPWPFGSEMEVDRTAFESSFYVAKYAKDHQLVPQQQLWYDKNKKKWYSHMNISDSATDALLQKQLKANLALRGTLEPSFNLLGTAWSGSYSLDYMSQMGGVALLDYAIEFSEEPAMLVNYGYNSLLSSWALMNTGNEKDGFGYWYPRKENDGAVGWVFTPWQNATTYFRNIPSRRWIWQYDGEIDHGLVGAIHGSSSIVIEDPLFGMVGYGAEITASHRDEVRFVPKDGVRQRVNLLLDNKRIQLGLTTDGFAAGAEIRYSRKTGSIAFSIESRQTGNHTATLQVKNLPTGKYVLQCDNGPEQNFKADENGKTIMLTLPVTRDGAAVRISRIGS